MRPSILIALPLLILVTSFAAAEDAKPVDPLEPTAEATLYVEMLNRARMDPHTERARLLRWADAVDQLRQDRTIDDVDGLDDIAPINAVVDAWNWWGVDADVFYDDYGDLAAKPPLAINPILVAAASAHCQAMALADEESYKLPDEPWYYDLMTAGGYDWRAAAINIFGTAESVAHARARFETDWGPGSDGMDEQAVDRLTCHRGRYRSVGFARHYQSDTSRELGPWVVTTLFGEPKHDDYFLCGVAFDDAMVADGFYSVREGIDGVTIIANAGDAYWTTTNWSFGAYSLRVPDGATYRVFMELDGGYYRLEDAVVAGGNVKRDFNGANPPRTVARRTITIRNGPDLAMWERRDAAPLGDTGTLAGDAYVFDALLADFDTVLTPGSAAN